jgi:hypothetical protein
MVADLMTGLLRDSLQPTDFADSDHRVGSWYFADFHGTATACRVHMVRTGGHWFQRHEWSRSDRNSTDMDDWLYLGHRPHKPWPAHFVPYVGD